MESIPGQRKAIVSKSKYTEKTLPVFMSLALMLVVLVVIVVETVK